MSVANSHHLGMVGYHIEPLAERGLLALAFSNSPAGIAPWGGNAAVFGTNPIALAAPREHDPPLVIDLSMAQVARGKIMMAASRGEPIPADWALDAHGKPTTDAADALAGTMMPMGGRKGAVLALLVELLAAGLTGSRFGNEAGSFFTAEGPPPGIGHLFIVFNPPAFSSVPLAGRVDALAESILAQPGTRLPGEGRLAKRARASREGVQIAENLLDNLRERAGTRPGITSAWPERSQARIHPAVPVFGYLVAGLALGVAFPANPMVQWIAQSGTWFPRTIVTFATAIIFVADVGGARQDALRASPRRPVPPDRRRAVRRDGRRLAARTSRPGFRHFTGLPLTIDGYAYPQASAPGCGGIAAHVCHGADRTAAPADARGGDGSRRARGQSRARFVPRAWR